MAEYSELTPTERDRESQFSCDQPEGCFGCNCFIKKPKFVDDSSITDSEKLEFLYQVALKADKALSEIMPQVEPLLKGLQSNPMLRMFLK